MDQVGWEDLVWAVLGGDADSLQRLVDLGVDVNAADSDGKTVLMHAAEEGATDAVLRLVDHGANVDAVDRIGKTALMYASQTGRTDAMQALVERGADVNAVDANGTTPVMFASASEDDDMDGVRLLLDGGADVNAANADGTTALMYASASRQGNARVVQLLVERGADVDAVDRGERTAVMHASASRHEALDVVQTLVAHGADLSAVDAAGKSVLMFASGSRRYHADVVRFIVEKGADVSAVDETGMTALMYAAEKGSIHVVQCLVERGGNVNAEDNDGGTALMRASKSGSANAVRVLVENGADVNASDSDGKTALMCASGWNVVEIVQFLVNGGADVNAANKHGKTVLMFASETGNVQVVQFLVASGAAVNVGDSDAKTALMYASDKGKTDVVQLLISVGAGVNSTDRAGRTAIFFAASKGHSDIQRLLTPLVRSTTSAIVSSEAAHQQRKPQQSTSWRISPFEIELLSLINHKDGSRKFQAKWLDTDVVVKLFVPGTSMASFPDEVAVWRQLRHPNVIKLYGACDVGHYFFVSELATNGSLPDHLAACIHGGVKRSPWKFLHEAALGLAYLHERKIVHGDLRGSNILIGSDGLAKLSEFGLSALTKASMLTTGTVESVFGSARWQSPERIQGGEPSYASDVYSLGLCIVEALSGEIPWSNKLDNFVMYWKERWDPAVDPFTQYSPGPLPDAVVDLVSQMCARDSAQRIPATVAAQTLERLAANDSMERQATRQPEPEPCVSIDDYKDGELIHLLEKTQAVVSRYAVDDFRRHTLDEVQAMYERLEQSSQPVSLLDQFRKLLDDVAVIVRPDSCRNRIQRLSSARATGIAMDGIRRRLDAICASLEGPHFENEARKMRWRAQRAQELDVFVSEIKETLEVLDELDSEEAVQALVAILKSEIDSHSADYSPGQMLVIQKAYDDLVHRAGSDAVRTTPEWFLPWYELEIDNLTCIGTGGFGGVYRAKWLDSEIVVKVLHQTGTDHSPSSFASLMASSWSAPSKAVTAPDNSENRRKMRGMFEREVTVWFGLSHPHIVRLFGACHIGSMFFACEYAPNGSLDRYLRAYPDELWQKLHEAALGVQYLHARGIVHGDLKCNNILIGGDGKAKVTDFGLSSDAALLGQADTQVSGASQWVAPECLEHGASQLSSASDVYALGMCVVEALRIVEMATRSIDDGVFPPVPWGNLDNATVKYHVVREGALPLRPQSCSDEEWMLVTRMCATDPSRRLKISTVVTTLREFASFRVSSEHDSKQLAADPEVELVSEADVDEEHDASSDRDRRRPHFLRRLWSRLKPRPTAATHDEGNTDNDSTSRGEWKVTVDLDQLRKAPAACVGSSRASVTTTLTAIERMKDRTGAATGAKATSRKIVGQIFALLCDRLAGFTPVVAEGGGDVECLAELVERAEQDTAALPDSIDTLIEFTQASLQGYALHRALDKLVEASALECDGDAWKARCNQFLASG